MNWRIHARKVAASALPCVFASLAAGSSWTNSAYADDAATQAGIVVTATKRPTLLLDTPMSVTVVDTKTLAQTHVDEFADIAALVPGLTYTDSGPGNKRYALRGLQSAGEPEVALYYDEVPVSGLPGASLDTGDSQPDFKLVDLQRVEVLRGPQGTLYGNGSMGGAIRIISHRPDLQGISGAAEGYVSATDGGNPSGGFDAMANIPVVKDRLAVRIVGYVRREGGWIDAVADPDIALPQLTDRNTNWEHTAGGRASASFQALPGWNITGIAYYQRTTTGAASDIYPAYGTASDPYVSKTYVRTPWRERAQLYNLISTTEFAHATLVATGSYQRRVLDRTTDTTRFLIGQFGCTELTWDQTCHGPPLAPAAGYAHETVSAWSGEVRLTSKDIGRLEYTVGAFLQRATTTRKTQVASVDAGGNVAHDPATGTTLGRLFERDNVDTFDQYALFGEASYRIVPRIKATAGLRYFNSDRTDQQVIVQQFFPGQPTGPQPFQQFRQGKLFQKYQLSYSIPSEGLIYLQAAQGFRSGGPNFPGGFAISAPPYGADSVWDYEFGAKFDLADGKLHVSGAVFHIVWSNLQQLVPTALFSYIANAGRAQSDGFETEVAFTPNGAWSVSGGVTYNDARLVGPQPAQIDPALQLQAGDKLANVPDWTARGSLAYDFALPAGFKALARLDGVYQSGRGDIVSLRNPAFFRIGSSALANLHIELTPPRTWSIGLDVDNLFDSFAPQSAKALDSNLVMTEAAARPRTITLRLAAAF